MRNEVVNGIEAGIDSCFDHHSFTLFGPGGHMEDYEAQEQEFWRKLEEGEMSRSQMLKRSVAAAAGLTVLGSTGAAFASRGAAGATPPLKGKSISIKELVAEAKKEGHINTIALPPDWANYGEIMSTFQKKYGLAITNDNPDGSSAQENQAITSLKGDSRAPDVVDVGPSFAVAGAASGLYGKYFPSTFSTIPRAMNDTRGFWYGDYWGAISIGYNQNLVSTPPTTWKDLLKPEYKGKVALNGSPLQSNSAVSGVIAAALANGGSVANVGPGIDFFATMKKSGNFIPVQTTSSTVASGQTPISIDWDYNNLAYVAEFPAARWKVAIPSDGVYGGYYAQAINAAAPHPWSARLWEEFLYSDQGQLLYLKGFAHPARFNDLAKRKKIPSSLLSALPAPALYAKAKFASLGQQTTAKATIATDWPAKVGA
jgi:putative spermidine/putrescine transport system substrate-binding protein